MVGPDVVANSLDGYGNHPDVSTRVVSVSQGEFFSMPEVNHSSIVIRAFLLARSPPLRFITF